MTGPCPTRELAPELLTKDVVADSEPASFASLPDALVVQLLSGAEPKLLARVACVSRRFASISEDVAEAACAAGGRRRSTSWIRSLRLAECSPALPGGETTDSEGYPLPLVNADVPRSSTACGARLSAATCCQNCGLTGNSWLNLLDGTVMCGRRQHDGSGGNGCALRHAQQLDGRLSAQESPLLVVKLGTVTCDLHNGVLCADVYDYHAPVATGGAVLVRDLGAALAHWGVDAAAPGLTKTCPSVAELGQDGEARWREYLATRFGWAVDEANTKFRALGIAEQTEVHNSYVAASNVKFAHWRRAMGFPD